MVTLAGERACPACGVAIDTRYESQVYCSRRCADDIRRRPLVPWNALQRSLLAYMNSNALSLGALAGKVGVDRGTLRYWFRHKGSAPTEATLSAVASTLSLSLEEAVGRAGIAAPDERRAAAARELIATARPEPGTAKARLAGQRMAAGRRGKPLSQAHRDAVSAAHKASGHRPDPTVAAAWRSSEEGRSVLRITRWLRGKAPSPELIQELRDRAATEASVLHMAGAQPVLDFWSPHLRRRGIALPVVGRPRDAERCGQIRALRQRWLTRPAGRSFWQWAAAEIRSVDLLAPDVDALERWDRRHRKDCDLCQALAADMAARRRKAASNADQARLRNGAAIEL